MNWDALGAIAETLGAIGVIATLAYLAVQIRQGSEQTALNTTAIHTTAFQDLIDHHANLQLHVLTHPELAEVLRKARELSVGELTPEELQIHGVFTTQQVRSFFNGFTLFQKGLIDESQWGVFRSNIKRVIASNAFPPFWKSTRLDYPSDFQAMVDDLMEESGDL